MITVTSQPFKPYINHSHQTANCNQLEVNKGPYNCYECNVWKAGYGHVCDRPRNRTGCWACMKIESVVFMGYYKNTPRCDKIYRIRLYSIEKIFTIFFLFQTLA